MTRIITGKARGRRLVAPKGETTRPTSDRAKKIIFSFWPTHSGLGGTRVLDLFAGLSAFGLEAASRGACSIVLMENDPNAIAATGKNIRTVRHSDVAISPMKVSSYLTGALGEPFDHVIVDPLYELAGEVVTEMLEALRSSLAPGAIVTAERHRDDDETQRPEGYEQLQQKLKRRIHGMAHFDTIIYNA